MLVASHEHKIAVEATEKVMMMMASDKSTSLCFSKANSVSISENLATDSASFKSSNVGSKFIPMIRSGSHTDVGARKLNEDQHIQINDLSNYLGDKYTKLPFAGSFYAIFDGHGGSEAASYVKDYVMKLIFDEFNLPQADIVDDSLLKELQDYHRKAFLQVDQALADECSISDYCGTTALSVLVLDRHLIIANAGDSRAVVSRKGVAVQMSNDHRPSYLQEKERVEKLGGYFEDGYLNGELGVTRALGDWYMKSPNGLGSVLIGEPEMRHMELSEEDEFMIIGCDGIWDVMSNEEAVGIVRRELLKNNDPQRCALEIINEALGRHAIDNLTAIVVCFTSHIEPPKAWRPKFRREK